MEKCHGEVLERSDGEHYCGEVLEKRVVEKCCREVLW